MKKFWRNTKGAVTVLVTWLMIPSILLTGTAVDVARLYAAKSIVQDANLLGANSALASYDALLKDLYGLYAIHDPNLTAMVEEYIQVAVFGDWKGDSAGIGMLQLLYGDEGSLSISTSQAQTLDNKDVLRRQIEEYMKLRAPIVIAEEVMEIMDTLEKTSADAAAIATKMDIEDDLSDIKKIYAKIYRQIESLNAYRSAEMRFLGDINQSLNEINKEMRELHKVRGYYEASVEEDSLEKQEDYEAYYDGILGNIHSLAKGGARKSEYQLGDYDEEGEYQTGHWQNEAAISSNDGLEKRGARGEEIIKEYQKTLGNLVDLLKKADRKKGDLKEKIEILKSQLNACSEDMKNGMQKEQEAYGNRSLLEVYEDLLAYDLSHMADKVNDVDGAAFEDMLRYVEGIGYGKNNGQGDSSLPMLRISTLADLSQNQYFSKNSQLFNPTGLPDLMLRYKSLAQRDYYYYSNGQFRQFQDISQEMGKFYQVLKSLNQADPDGSKEGKVKNAMKEMLKFVQDTYKGLINDPEGAYVYQASNQAEKDAGFGSQGDWGQDGEAKDQTKEAMENTFFDQVATAVSNSVDKILLITYDTQMFSNYASNRKEGEKAESLTGAPFGVDVNYYYQSEQEYLYHGDQGSAKNNLRAVEGTILLIRFICNYIKSFSVTSVTRTVREVRNAIPAFPANVIVSELVRFGMAMGQAVLDLSQLRNGEKVPFLHSDSTWQLSLEGMMAGSLSPKEVLSQLVGKATASHPHDAMELEYSSYMTLFLFLVGEEQLLERTKFLIELNMANYKEKVGKEADRGARERKMASLPRYRFSNSVTGFTLTSSVDVDTLFLSLPAAQRGANGVAPKKEYTVSDTIYRGY